MLSRARNPIASTTIASQRLPRATSISRHIQCQYRLVGSTTANRAALATESATETSWAAPLAEERRGPQTLTEKILQDHAVGLPKGKTVRSGSFVSVRPWRCMTHDNTWPVAKKYLTLGVPGLNDPDQMVFALDHDIQNKSESNQKKYSLIEEFAKKHGVDFYGAGHGISHQVMVQSLATTSPNWDTDMSAD